MIPSLNTVLKFALFVTVLPALVSCAQVDIPGSRNLRIPSPQMADERPNGVNEQPDSVLYLPLGRDVLVPETSEGVGLPSQHVGPFELRSETLAGALQLILADYEIPLAFESDEGLTRTITVANLRGPLDRVVERICSLADLYCAYEDGLLIVKERQTFTVAVPPIGGDTDVLSSLAAGLQSITGAETIADEATRTIVYEASNRTSKLAERYFQRIRANTALIVFEVYMWEVGLNNSNSTGIDWQEIQTFGKFSTGINIPGGSLLNTDSESPISIGLPTTGETTFGEDDIFEFISTYGAVKTISQPQITVLSGAEATLRVADTINYVSSLTRSIEDGETTVSTETDTVDTGFTLTINSAWDKATIYGTIEIALEEFLGFDDFDADGTTLSLPRTTERELTTQIRVRPGDSVLIAGLVRENDEFDKEGIGFNEPIIPNRRGASVENTELVFLLKPRVIVYTSENIEEIKAGRRSRFEKANRKSGASHLENQRPASSISVDMLDPSL